MDAMPDVNNILSSVKEKMKRAELYEDTVQNVITAFFFITIAIILKQHWDYRLIAISGVIYSVIGVLIKQLLFFKQPAKTESGDNQVKAKSKFTWYKRNEDDIRLLIVYAIMYFLLGKMQNPYGYSTAVSIIFALCLIGWIFTSSLTLINPYKRKARIYEVLFTLPFIFILWKFHLVHGATLFFALLAVAAYKIGICIGVCINRWQKPNKTESV
jgi:hypothetical protein